MNYDCHACLMTGWKNMYLLWMEEFVPQLALAQLAVVDHSLPLGQWRSLVIRARGGHGPSSHLLKISFSSSL
jgi:hypothetical protein